MFGIGKKKLSTEEEILELEARIASRDPVKRKYAVCPNCSKNFLVYDQKAGIDIMGADNNIQCPHCHKWVHIEKIIRESDLTINFDDNLKLQRLKKKLPEMITDDVANEAGPPTNAENSSHEETTAENDDAFGIMTKFCSKEIWTFGLEHTLFATLHSVLADLVNKHPERSLEVYLACLNISSYRGDDGYTLTDVALENGRFAPYDTLYFIGAGNKKFAVGDILHIPRKLYGIMQVHDGFVQLVDVKPNGEYIFKSLLAPYDTLTTDLSDFIVCGILAGRIEFGTELWFKINERRFDKIADGLRDMHNNTTNEDEIKEIDRRLNVLEARMKDLSKNE